MTETPILPGLETLVKPFRFRATPHEFAVKPLKECPTPENLVHCDNADKAADYWRMHIATNAYFNSECECFAVLLLNARRRIRGHQLVSFGTQDTILISPGTVFRLAIATAAHSILAMHNHPSGESGPSEADIRATRDLIRAGQLLKIELLDHVIVGNGNCSSLKALGYFYL